MKKLYGHIGQPNPLLRSLHQAAFEAEGIDAEYRMFDIDPSKPQDLENFCYETDLNQVGGFSVSQPYQHQLMRLMDHYDSLTKKVGYLNTVMNENSLLIGYNTQVMSIARVMQEKTALAGKKVLILGAKSLGRGICYALKEFGMELFMWDEDTSRAEDASKELEVESVTFSQIKEIGMQIIVNTSDKETSDFGKNPLTADHLKPDTIIIETTMENGESSFVKPARASGAQVISSERVLLYEAAGQFEIWFDKNAPLKAMEAALALSTSLL